MSSQLKSLYPLLVKFEDALAKRYRGAYEWNIMVKERYGQRPAIACRTGHQKHEAHTEGQAV